MKIHHNKIVFSLLTTSMCISSCKGEYNYSNKSKQSEGNIPISLTYSKNMHNIVLYMKDHEASGQVASTKTDYAYYRVLIKELPNKKYLVQDFYKSGKKLTEPYILTDGKLEYAYNEDESSSFYPREGKRILYYESGKKSAETQYSNNHESGVWVEWFENGHKSFETPYHAGKINGIKKEWNDDGKLVSECTYSKGIENGECFTKYTTNPNIYIFHGYYKNGKKTGVWKEWDENGKLTKTINY